MLGWSINLFRVFRIRLAVHFSFLLLVAWAAWAGWTENPTERWAGLTLDLALIALLFTCVVLHELGHCLVARHYGIGVSRILLLPIGGMAEFDSIPRQPRRELLISLAGPAVNFSIALLLLPFVPWPGEWNSGTIEFSAAGLADFALRLNLIMGAFNLLPVFPMDGGRVLRAILATRCPYLKATFWAATVGKAIALLVVLGAVWCAVFEKQQYPLLVCLFLFIAIAGELEYRAVRRRELQKAQWESLIRNLYGPGNAGDAVPADYLHGPN
jgi:Zn-dependent protease